MNLVNDFPIEKVDLERKIKFKNSKVTWQGIPVIFPPNEICSTIEVAKALPNVLTFVSDEYEVEELYDLYFDGSQQNTIYKLNSMTKFTNLIGKLPKGYLQHVCVEGEINDVLSKVTELRRKHKNVTIWYNGTSDKWLDETIVDNLTQNGVDVVIAKHYSQRIIKIREGYDVSTDGDFIPIQITEGFEEFKGETDDNLNRTFKDVSLPFSENTLESFYNNQVDDIRKRVFSAGCRTIEIYSNFAREY